jgi:hypothetical protein
VDLRTRIRDGINLAGSSILEVGPLYRPFVLKDECDAIYVDHTDTESLRAKYRDDPKFDVATIVDVDAVWGEKTLLQCLDGRHVDYVIASHVIEHVPDVITWLSELSSVLKDSGQIRLVIPDKRYTFDFLRQETEFHDLADAYLRKTRIPLPRCIIDHLCHMRDGVDVAVAWRGAIDPASLKPVYTYPMAEAIALEVLAEGSYHDVHCWVFTPISFVRLMHEAARHGLINVACDAFESTLPDTLEFIVFLRKGLNQQEIIESWADAEQTLATGNGPSHAANVQDIEERAIAAEAALVQARNAFEAHLNIITTSRSWRLTAPLRALMKRLRQR